jgi:hypothetical protein
MTGQRELAIWLALPHVTQPCIMRCCCCAVRWSELQPDSDKASTKARCQCRPHLGQQGGHAAGGILIRHAAKGRLRLLHQLVVVHCTSGHQHLRGNAQWLIAAAPPATASRLWQLLGASLALCNGTRATSSPGGSSALCAAYEQMLLLKQCECAQHERWDRSKQHQPLSFCRALTMRGPR